MSTWETGFYKVAGVGDVLKKLRVGVGQKDAAMAALKAKTVDRAVLKAKPKGGYASLDEGSVNKNFNLSGFQRGTSLPKR